MTQEKLSKESEILAEYECRECKRKFYVIAGTRTNSDIEFGCPYGCDDNGKPMRQGTFIERK